ncbi:hypothetical protein Droror1_Dr00019723 [Drosera rotundifolia]
MKLGGVLVTRVFEMSERVARFDVFCVGSQILLLIKWCSAPGASMLWSLLPVPIPLSAAKFVAENKSKEVDAVASVGAAKICGLNILHGRNCRLFKACLGCHN